MEEFKGVDFSRDNFTREEYCEEEMPSLRSGARIHVHVIYGNGYITYMRFLG